MINKTNIKSTVLNFIRLYLLYSILEYSVVSVFAQEENGLTVSGFLDLKFFVGPHKPLSSMCSYNRFRASISSDGRWAIEIIPIHQQGDMMFAKQEQFYLTYDGTDTYFCHYTEAVQGFKGERPAIIGTKSIEENDQVAYISSGNYPFAPYDEQSRGQVLWLIFGGGKYINESQTNSMPLPWIPARWSLDTYGFRWDYKLSSKFPYVPLQLKFVRDLKLDFTDQTSEFNRPELIAPNSDKWFQKWNGELQDRHSRWADGKVAGDLETSNLTNINNFEIPLTFTLKVFAASSKTIDNIRRLYTATITNISTMSPTETFRPILMGKKIRVDDTRFAFSDKTRKVDEIYYSLDTNSAWKTRDDPSLQEQFSSVLGAHRSLRIKLGHESNVRLIAVIAFLLISLTFPCILIWKHRKKPA